MTLLRRLAGAMPELGAALAAWAASSENQDLPYVAAAELADLASARMLNGEDMRPLLDALEHELADGSPSDRNLLIVGLLERLQNQLAGSAEEQRLLSQAGPETLRAWAAVSAVWAGRITSDAFNRIVAGPASDA